MGVIGSRTFNDYSLVCYHLDQYRHTVDKIVSGGAIGADQLGVKWACDNDIPYEEFLPKYKIYGKRAPFIRNKDIVNNSDIILAFWDLKSNGTKHSLDYAKFRRVKSVVIPFTNVNTERELDLWQL